MYIVYTFSLSRTDKTRIDRFRIQSLGFSLTHLYIRIYKHNKTVQTVHAHQTLVNYTYEPYETLRTRNQIDARAPEQRTLYGIQLYSHSRLLRSLWVGKE